MFLTIRLLQDQTINTLKTEKLHRCAFYRQSLLVSLYLQSDYKAKNISVTKQEETLLTFFSRIFQDLFVNLFTFYH